MLIMSSEEGVESPKSIEELEPIKALARSLIEELRQYKVEMEIVERDYRFPEDHLSDEWTAVHYRLVNLFMHHDPGTSIPFFSPPKIPTIEMIEECDDPNELNRFVTNLRNYLIFVRLLRAQA